MSDIDTIIAEVKRLDAEATPSADIILALTDETDGNEWWCPRCNVTVPASHVTYTETHDKEGCGEQVWYREEAPLRPLRLVPMAHVALAAPLLAAEVERLRGEQAKDRAKAAALVGMSRAEDAKPVVLASMVNEAFKEIATAQAERDEAVKALRDAVDVLDHKKAEHPGWWATWRERARAIARKP